MKYESLALLLAVLGATAADAKEASMDAGTLAHELDRLSSTARVLYVAAHPDDENTRLLAHLANQRHATVAYLSLTRGSGGQNLIGTEQGDLLGILRTEELLAARRIDAAHQRFTRMRDAGYSKSADETLATWGREEALADVVWVVRSFRPDVIITRFDETPPNHGHHTASAILAREAFAAAADPDRFPEQLERGVETWQATRLLHNLSTWRPVTIPDNAIAIDVGGYDPRLGLSMGELAALSRSQHKSQGFGRAGERGVVLEHLVPLAGDSPENDLLEGIESTWARFGDRARTLVATLVGARAALERDRPEAAVPALLAARDALDELPDVPRVRDARHATEALLLRCIGLFARANAASAVAAPGASVDVEVELIARRPSAAALVATTFPFAARESQNEALTAERTVRLQRTITIPEDHPISAPFWLERAPDPGRYHVSDPTMIDQPRAPTALGVDLEIRFGEREIPLRLPVVHAWTDRVHGERVRRFLVAPPVTVTPVRDSVLAVSGAAAPLALRVHANRDGVDAVVTVPVPEGWSVEPATVPLRFERAGEEKVVEVAIAMPADAPQTEIRPQATIDGTAWSWREDVIDYPHVPLQQVFRPAVVRVAPVALTRPDGLIGYVEGSGDTVVDDLGHVGFRVERLDDATLLAGDLGRYAAILVGIRAYNTREALRRAHPRLVDYAAAGGTVVVQYNTNTQWDPLRSDVGPAALTIGRGRVTDETAAMIPLDPNAPLLRRPNEIGSADFAGWVQERGLYFAESWDERWTPMIAVADPGEEPQRGSVLAIDHGEGRWVYTGLSFFRQLPAGVPGAYRLLANLLASSDAP